mmetsp:Transcript_10492/g.42415  ORF Transcript_10492/g.42415 Transcript_10492/m.42415 type:complete len:371 (-) Transcript_10492:603-1715(-)
MPSPTSRKDMSISRAARVYLSSPRLSLALVSRKQTPRTAQRMTGTRKASGRVPFQSHSLGMSARIQMGPPRPETMVPATVVASSSAGLSKSGSVPTTATRTIATRPIQTCLVVASASASGLPTSRKPWRSGPAILATDVKVESSVEMPEVIMMIATSEYAAVPSVCATAAGLPLRTSPASAPLSSFSEHAPSRTHCPSMAPWTPMSPKRAMNHAAQKPPAVMARAMVRGDARKHRSVRTGSKNGYERPPCTRPSARRSMPPLSESIDTLGPMGTYSKSEKCRSGPSEAQSSSASLRSRSAWMAARTTTRNTTAMPACAESLTSDERSPPRNTYTSGSAVDRMAAAHHGLDASIVRTPEPSSWGTLRVSRP